MQDDRPFVAGTAAKPTPIPAPPRSSEAGWSLNLGEKLYVMLLKLRYAGFMALPERLAAAAARTELSAILREFAELNEPADSIGALKSSTSMTNWVTWPARSIT